MEKDHIARSKAPCFVKEGSHDAVRSEGVGGEKCNARNDTVQFVVDNKRLKLRVYCTDRNKQPSTDDSIDVVPKELAAEIKR